MRPAFLVAVGCLMACGTGQGGTPSGGGAPGGSTPGPVTYYGEVQPLVAAHCGGCHAPGGLAPFSLLTYDDARGHAGTMAGAAQSGEMPPWPPAAGCGDFRAARRLSPAEVGVLAAWAEGGAPAGDPTGAPPPTPDPGVDLGPPSVTLDPGAAYQPDATTTDDYHCFLVDPGLASAQDLIGLGVHPGTPAAVHHVLLFAVPPSDLAAAQDKDAAEPGVGWSCFAGSGLGTGVDAPQAIGGWVPGAGASAFPAGTGISLDAGSWMIVQVHYNLDAQPVAADRTTVDLYYAAAPVARHALVLPIENDTFSVPAGATATVAADQPIIGAWALWGIAPHMHLHGTEISLTIEHPGGGSTCAIDIPHWSFHWQGFYYYQQPLPVVAGDVVHLACTFDNGAGTAPLAWGEKTSDEMCLAYVYFTPL